MMEYQVPNQRPNAGLERFLEQSMVQNLPHQQRMQELNEAMGQMSLGPYPERADMPDCAYYSRTGSCAFGMNCRFNHPPHSKQVPRAGDTPQKTGQAECQFYLKGACKFGTMCKFEHSNQKEGCGQEPKFNFLGLPIRERERECTYYIRTGSCKYGVTCKFHHPEPGSEGMPGSVSNSPLQMTTTNPSASSSENSYSPVHPSWSLPKAPYPSSIHLQEHTAYMDAVQPSPKDMPAMPVLGNYYQNPINPFSSSEGNQHPTGIGLMNVQTNSRSLNGPQTVSAFGTGPFGFQSAATVTGRNIFPERPGQPECQHYLKTGNCKFAAACKFHHPRSHEQSNLLLSSERKELSVGVENAIKNSNDLTTSTQGSVFSTFKPVSSSTMAFPVVQTQASVMQKRTFPERPGQAECQCYLKTGDCRFGDACLYHHPKERLEQSSAFTFSATSPPVHFDKPACTFYSRYGICKFGPMCKFDHPLPVSTCNPSAYLNSELPGDQFPKGNPSTNT